jgi:hypothetical protein
MQYSVRGRLNTTDDTKIKGVINKYRVLDKESLASGKDESGKPNFYFEYKTKDLSKKNGMFADFKALVDEYTGAVDWHECSHDEANPQPCVITESYEVG